MSDFFDKSLNFVLAQEGGYSNHSSDSGGETMMGITAGTLGRAYKAGLVSCNNVKALKHEDVAEIYHCFYWLPSRADQMPWPLACIHLDAAVNHGVTASSRLLQKTLNFFRAELAVDGKIGPLTLRALINAADIYGVKAVCDTYLDERKSLYEKIVKKNGAQKIFWRGWMRRLEQNRKFVDDNAL